MCFFLTLACVCVLLCLLMYVISIIKNAADPPFVSGRLPIIGNLLRLLFTDNMFDFAQDIGTESVRNGGVSILDLGIRKVCVVTDPDDCLKIANTCLEKDKSYSLGRTLLGKGLLISDVPTWKKHRKLLNPAFSQTVLNSFVETFNSQARLLVQMFGEGLGRPINHEHLLRINNLETICLTTTDINQKEHEDLKKQYVVLIDELLNIMTTRFRKFWLQCDAIFNLTQLKKKEDEAIRTINILSKEIIEIKKAKMRIDKMSQHNSSNMKPFMDLILDLADETGCFTDEEVREETNNIIIAGYDTTASILTYVFTVLGSYPEIQEKVVMEIQEAFGNTKENLDKADLSKLIYTEAVLKETLRLYPVGAVVGRYSDKPMKLKKYTIKANTGYFLMVNELHRHPMWGLDADLFRPERWLDTASLPDLNYFGGFGLGRRNCIGQIYAMMSMKIVVGHVIRRYRISADVTKMTLTWDVMTRPQGTGHHITLQLRE